MLIGLEETAWRWTPAEFEGAELFTTERPEAQPRPGGKGLCPGGPPEGAGSTGQGTPPVPALPRGCCADLHSPNFPCLQLQSEQGKAMLE